LIRGARATPLIRLIAEIAYNDQTHSPQTGYRGIRSTDYRRYIVTSLGIRETRGISVLGGPETGKLAISVSVRLTYCQNPDNLDID